MADNGQTRSAELSSGRHAGRAWRALKWGAGTIAAILLLVLLWGVGIEPRLVDERSETAPIPRLPSEWEGTRIALIADLQIGMWLANTDTVRRIVERVIAERPAALLIAGDFLYHPTDEAGEPREARQELERDDVRALRTQIAEIKALLEPVPEAGITVFAVLGNHDYAMRVPESLPLPVVADDLTQALREIGVTVLRNESAPLGSRDQQRRPEDRLAIVGLDAWFHRATEPEAALAQVAEGTPRLLLMHNPLSFRRLPPGSAPMALAAHTHGGQIRLPFLPHWSWLSLVKDAPVEADGWSPPDFGAAGNRLYVNRGIGFSNAPVRINCRPELTWFTLTAAEDRDAR